MRLIWWIKVRNLVIRATKFLSIFLRIAVYSWNDARSAPVYPTTCSRRVSIFFCVFFFFSCVGGVEVVVWDGVGVEGITSFVQDFVAVAWISLWTLALLPCHWSISINLLHSCFLSLPEISFVLLSVLYLFKMILYFFLHDNHDWLNSLTIRIWNSIHELTPTQATKKHIKIVK